MLLLVFLMMTLGLFALFLGGGLLAQGYLYQQVADRMPLRALGGALLVGAFITLWVSIDRKYPGRYDVFYEFKGESQPKTDFEKKLKKAAEDYLRKGRTDLQSQLKESDKAIGHFSEAIRLSRRSPMGGCARILANHLR